MRHIVMERNCHLIDLHKVIMAVILTAIKNQKNLHTLLDKPSQEDFGSINLADKTVIYFYFLHPVPVLVLACFMY